MAGNDMPSGSALLKRSKRSVATYFKGENARQTNLQKFHDFLEHLLAPQKPIDDFEPLEWCRWLIAGGSTFDEFAKTGEIQHDRLIILNINGNLNLFILFSVSLVKITIAYVIWIIKSCTLCFTMWKLVSWIVKPTFRKPNYHHGVQPEASMASTMFQNGGNMYCGHRCVTRWPAALLSC